MFSFGRKKTGLLGVDISSTTIKLIELSQTGGGPSPLFHVVTYAVEPLPANAMVEKKITDVDVVGQAIRKAVVHSGTKANHAAVAVPDLAVITKVISMGATLSAAAMEIQI